MSGVSLSFDELRERYKVSLRKNEPTEAIFVQWTEWGSSDNNNRCALEQAFRELLLETVDQKQQNIEGFIDFCIECCRRDLVSPTMPVVLLGDVFDAITLEKCEKLFDYVENGVNTWKEELFFIACKNNLLRMCNDLLRRLSRSQNTIFCGRILLFLAKFFPFSERSGLNIVSEFNSDNITELGGDADLKDNIEEEDSSEDTKKSGITIDYNLYCKFWALQDFFRNPNSCYNKVQWKTFASHSSCVLSAFSSYKLESIQLKENTSRKRSSMAMETNTSEDQEKHYFAKFLTNQKLLELQLSDSNFRRYILVQFLILFQYLQSSVKFKMESFELKTEQNDWVKETTDQVYKLIAETPPDGSNFASRVKHILKREELWNTWKNDGCPEFKKLKANIPVDTASTEETRKILKPRRKRLLGDIIKDYDNRGKYFMGNNELTKLWNLCPDNLEACKGKDREFLPVLETYFSEAIEQNERGVEGDERLIADINFGWRALRLLACRTPYFFSHTNATNRLSDYLETMVNKIARDLYAATDNKRSEKETAECEVTEEQMEADLIKEGDSNDVDQPPDSEIVPGDGEESNEKSQSITEQQMSDVCEKLQGDWKKLAAKLGFKEDEILFFKQENPTNPIRAQKMLEIYFQDDEDASVENLAYILEGLGLLEAAAVLKEPED